jgi:hypothetical protein
MKKSWKILLWARTWGEKEDGGWTEKPKVANKDEGWKKETVIDGKYDTNYWQMDGVETWEATFLRNQKTRTMFLSYTRNEMVP